MIDKNGFINALNGLFFYWGGDTPPEVFWGCNDMLDWYELQFNLKLNIRFDEEIDGYNFDKVITAIRNTEPNI